MVFSSLKGTRPGRPRQRGRPKKSPEIPVLWLAFDSLRPGVVTRRDRFQACLDQLNADRGDERHLTLHWVAKKLSVDPRALADFIDRKGKRGGAIDETVQQTLATMLCGCRACAPWLAEGHWVDPKRFHSSTVPDWLRATNADKQLREIARWLVLGGYRRQKPAMGTDAKATFADPDSREVLGDPPSPHDRAYWNADTWKHLLPEIEEQAWADFTVVLAGMRRYGLWHMDFLRLAPFQAGRAFQIFLDSLELISKLPMQRQSSSKKTPQPRNPAKNQQASSPNPGSAGGLAGAATYSTGADLGS